MSTKILSNIVDILKHIGEDPNRPEIKDTPKRYLKALLEYTSGYDKNPEEILNKARQQNSDLNYNEPIIITGINFVSLCEHHLAPMIGEVCLAYIPKEYLAGLSKLSRIVKIFSSRLQSQERLNKEIINCIDKIIQPKGAVVLIKANHTCISTRGINQKNNITTSILSTGLFKDENKYMDLFLKICSSTK